MGRDDPRLEMCSADGTETVDIKKRTYKKCPICGSEAIRMQRRIPYDSFNPWPQPQMLHSICCRYHNCVMTMTSTSRKEVEELWEKLTSEKKT